MDESFSGLGIVNYPLLENPEMGFPVEDNKLFPIESSIHLAISVTDDENFAVNKLKKIEIELKTNIYSIEYMVFQLFDLFIDPVLLHPGNLKRPAISHGNLNYKLSFRILDSNRKVLNGCTKCSQRTKFFEISGHSGSIFTNGFKESLRSRFLCSHMNGCFLQAFILGTDIELYSNELNINLNSRRGGPRGRKNLNKDNRHSPYKK